MPDDARLGQRAGAVGRVLAVGRESMTGTDGWLKTTCLRFDSGSNQMQLHAVPAAAARGCGDPATRAFQAAKTASWRLSSRAPGRPAAPPAEPTLRHYPRTRAQCRMSPPPQLRGRLAALAWCRTRVCGRTAGYACARRPSSHLRARGLSE